MERKTQRQLAGKAQRQTQVDKQTMTDWSAVGQNSWDIERWVVTSSLHFMADL